MSHVKSEIHTCISHWLVLLAMAGLGVGILCWCGSHDYIIHSLILITVTCAWASPTRSCFDVGALDRSIAVQEFNDSLSVTYLASVQKSAGSVNDLADKFMVAFGHRRI